MLLKILRQVKAAMIKSLLTEYGLNWTVNRLLYLAKLNIMSAIPGTDRIFEKNVNIKRIDIFDFNTDEIQRFLKQIPIDKQRGIISAADKSIRGIIKGFSSVELDYGYPINWHYNPITKAECNRPKWYLIPDFDLKRGDIKVIWEASRLAHFFFFVRAYLITEDKKYYSAFSSELEQWIKENPYPYGANYKCGQECALRMINALIAYSVFRKSGLITADDEKNVFKLVEVCYKKILSNFFYTYKCIKNNHTLSEICGLIIGSWCSENERELRKAYKLFDKEVEKQFMPDGGYKQYSFNYQRFALQITECVLKLSEKTGISLSENTRKYIAKSAVSMYQLQDDNGSMPNFGPNDGALIFPVTICSYHDFRPVVNTIYALIYGKRLYDPGDHDEELLWFGSKKLKDICVEHMEKKSSSFEKSGLYSFRHDKGFMMIFLQNFKTRPAQMDGLHIDLWHKGENIFCDSGTYSYADDLGRRLSLTAAHNTVKVDGIEQMNKHGAFLIYDWTSCRDVKYDYENFSGTMISENGYRHTRKVFKTNQGYDISDEVNGIGESCSFLFHTPCEVKVNSYGFELFRDKEKLCEVKTGSNDIEIQKVYRSLHYLRKEEINCIVIRTKMNNHKCNLNTSIILL